jgi:hypothetical protein
MVYLLTADGAGGALTFANDGGATPDLQTDAVAGPLKRIFLARVNGLGVVAAGVALTQAQARSLLFSDNTSSMGNINVPRAIVFLDGANRSGTTAWSSLDANVDGGGDPVITVTASAAAGTIYLNIVALGIAGY